MDGLILRLFVDGRTSCDFHTILATIKIHGHGGKGAQPELIVAIVIAPKKKKVGVGNGILIAI